MYDKLSVARAAMGAGANGFVLNRAIATDITDAIEAGSAVSHTSRRAFAGPREPLSQAIREGGWTMNPSRVLLVLASLLLLGGCATRPINPPITQADPRTGYRFETRQAEVKNKDNLVVLAFSGGGTRAAAFSYGVLEFLRRTELVGPRGNRVRLLDEVDVITGVSGGSFTALAYGLYGDKLFADYEQRFLKRDVQGDLLSRALNPGYWGDLSSTGWGRSELAAQLYDEILFNGATFGDLDRGDGPFIMASATDISSGARLTFNQNLWNALCSNLDAVRLSL